MTPLKGIGASIAVVFLAAAQGQPDANSELHTIHVQGNVYMIAGAGGNVTVQAGTDGVLLVNSGKAQNAAKLLAEIRKLSKGPIRYLINTDIGADHVGGNQTIFAAGSSVTGGNVTGDIKDAGVGATVIAHQAILNRMSAATGKSAVSTKAWPNDTYFTKQKKIFFNGEAIEILHIPSAQTDGDSIVFFRRSDVVSTGDLYVTTGYPIVDLERGGNIQGVLDGLNRVVDISVPADKQEGGTYVIPGHGRVADQADVVEYRDMITIIRDRIADGVKKGLTLQQVKAAQPVLDYDAVFGSAGGEWTTDMFLEATYKSLLPKK